MAALTEGQQQGAGGGEYRMVRSDRGCENVWASRNHTGVLLKTPKMAGRYWGESTKCATFKIQAVEAANLRVFVGMVKGDAELKIFHSMLKTTICLLLQISLEMLLFSWGIVHRKEGRGYSRFHGTGHGYGLK